MMSNKLSVIVILGICAHFSSAVCIPKFSNHTTVSLGNHKDKNVSTNETKPQYSIPDKISNQSENRREQTLILIKPDGVQRKLIGRIIDRFENKGLKLVGLKLILATKEMAEKHYAQHINCTFYHELIKFMTSSPLVAMVWEGRNVVMMTRKMIGKSMPDISMPGTIRGDFSIDIDHNVVHGSHSVEAARNEIKIWFQDSEVISWSSTDERWIYLL